MTKHPPSEEQTGTHMKRALILLLAGCSFLANAAQSPLAPLLQQGLFEEEANQNLPAAITAYEAVVREFDKDRRLAATAVFRLGECYRKQGRTNEAVAQYQRVDKEFSDIPTVANVSRQALARLVSAPAADLTASVDELKMEIYEEPTQEYRRIQALINNSPDLINAPDAQGFTLLDKAAFEGNLDIVKLLLDSGAMVNGPKQPGTRPLHHAAAKGHKAVVDLLLSRGAKADTGAETGGTPLHLAAMRGYVEVAKSLLKAGAPVNVLAPQGVYYTTPEGTKHNNEGGGSPLHLAAFSGSEAMVKLLLETGAEVNVLDRQGMTALGRGARYPGLVKSLLEAKADPNAGRTPAVHAAIKGSSIESLEMLLRGGGDPNLPAPEGGGTPLQNAVWTQSPRAIELLGEFKVDVNASQYSDGNPLFHALTHTPTLKALLATGMNPNLHRPDGWTPLHEAVAKLTLEAVELLLKAGAEVNATAQDRGTPLHVAAQAKYNPQQRTPGEIMKALLNADADVTARMRVEQWTPLHIAVQVLNPVAVELLLEKQANPNVFDNAGRTPLDYTKSFGRNEIAQQIAKLLRVHGARDDIAKMDRIMVRRGNYSDVVVYRSTNTWHQATNSGFTMLEVLTLCYSGGPSAAGSRLPFPDLSNIRLLRPGSDGRWQDREIDVRSILRGDCTGDLPLQWGDVVEIPEIPHPVGEIWPGFSTEEAEGFKRCLDREVQLIVEGESAGLKLALGTGRTAIQTLGPAPARTTGITQFVPPFRLRQAVLGSGRILSTSDLSRVKVRRLGENAEWVIDCSDAAPAGPDFWLKNGDVIEVPAKCS